MEHDGKNQSPYRGMWVILSLMIGLPIIVYLFLYVVLINLEKNSSVLLNEATARFLGFIIGTAFHLIFALCGGFAPSLKAVIKRIGEFFSNLIVSLPFAIKNYFLDMKRDGVAFIIYLAVMAGCVAIWVDALRDILRILGPTWF